MAKTYPGQTPRYQVEVYKGSRYQPIGTAKGIERIHLDTQVKAVIDTSKKDDYETLKHSFHLLATNPHLVGLRVELPQQGKLVRLTITD